MFCHIKLFLKDDKKDDNLNISISVIVPVYNVEQYLKKCIESILGQTYLPTEIILVDDGSTDSSGVICDEYKKKNSIINVIHKKNGGLSSARNVGLNICRGDYISFIDSDDWINENMYKDFVEKINEKQVDIVIGRRNRIDQYGNLSLEKFRRYPKTDLFDNVTGLAYLMSFCGFDMSVCDKIFNRKIIGNIRFPDGKTCEDSFTTYKFFSNAKKICYLNKAYYNYTYRENSLTRNSVVNETVIEATKEQTKFIDLQYPELECIADSSFGFALLSVYNEYIKRDCEWKDLLNARHEMKKNLVSIFCNKYVGNSKKIQALLFAYAPTMYKSIIKRFKKW